MTLSYRPPTADDIAHIAANMRDQDCMEVLASHGHSPLQALVESIGASSHTFCVVLDGEPSAIFGFTFDPLVDNAASVWFLGTDKMQQYRKLFMEESRRIVGEWSRIFPRLYNWVDTENSFSLRWLKWLGFRRTRSEDRGPLGQTFDLMVLGDV